MIILGDAWTEIKRDSHTEQHDDGTFATVEEVTYQRFISATLEGLKSKKQNLEANLQDCNEVIARFEKEKKEG